MNNFRFWLSRKINFPLCPPEVIQVSLTYRCNLRCKMCSIPDLLPKEEELSTRQICHIIDEAKQYGIKELLLTGGEPFMRPDLFDICEYAHQNDIRSIITTNGVLIDEALAERIAGARISHIHISLDGPEETNDYFRGKGAFRKIVEGVNILNKKRQKGTCHFSLGIACTVMDENVGQLYELVKFADELNIDAINFQPLIKDNANFLDKGTPAFWVHEGNIPALSKEIKKIRNYRPRHITVYEEPGLELLVKYYTRGLSRKDWVCFGGFKTVFICFDKNEPLIYSCHGVCGNLEKASLKDAWSSKEAYQLRTHSRDCKDLCIQSCYSNVAAQSLRNALGLYKK